MTKKNMLIDAAHPEEVRVAVIDNGKIEDFDFESAARKPLRGNIYLARVTRVEPSLQAAFVEYGGNRHGFLAFSEIHPDYYQIPVADREALQASEAEVADLAAQLELAQRGDEEDFDDADDSDVPDEDMAAPDTASQETASNDTDIDASAGDSQTDENPESENDAAAEIVAEADDATDVKTASADTDTPSDADNDDEIDEEDEEEDVKKGAAEDADKVETEAETDGDENVATDAEDVVEAEGIAEEDVAEAQADDDDADAQASAETDSSNDDDVTSESTAIEASAEDDSDESADDESTEEENVKEESESERAAREARAERNALFERYKEAKRKRSQLLRNYKIQEVIKRRQILLVQAVKEERGNKGAALTTYMSLAGRYCVLMPNTARGGGISRKIPNASDRRRLRRVVDGLDVPQGMGLIIRTAGAKRTKTEIKRDYDYLLRLWENIRTLTLKSIAPCLIYEEANLIKRAIRDLYDKDISEVLVEGENGYREAKDFMKMLMPSHAKNVQPYKSREPIFLKHGVENQLDGMYQPSVRLKSGGYIVIHQTEALIAIDVNSGRATRERNIELTALKTNIEAAHEAARQFRLRDLAGLIVIDFIDMEEQRNNRKVEKALKEGLKTDRARIQVGRISNFGLLEMSRQRRRSGIVDGTTQICPTCAGAGVIRSHEMAALRILRAIEGEAISGKVGHIIAHTSLDVSLYILNHNRDWLKRIEDENGVLVAIQADPEKAGDAYDLVKSGVPRERKIDKNVIRADQVETMDADDDSEIAEAETEASDDQEGRGEQGRKRRRRRRRRKDAARDNDDATETKAEEDGEQSSDQEAEASSEDGDEEKPKRRRRRGRRGGRRSRKGENNRDSENENAAESEAVVSGNDNPEKPAADSQPSADSEGPQPDYMEFTPHAEAEPPVAVEAANTDNGSSNNDGESGNDRQSAGKSASGEASVKDSEAPEETASEDAKPTKRSRKGWWQRATGL